MTAAIELAVATGVVLFGVGLIGLLVRRNLLIMLMCVELMLNGCNVLLVAYSRLWADQAGHMMAFVVIAVAAAEVGVGLGIVLSLFRRRDTLDVGRYRMLKH